MTTPVGFPEPPIWRARLTCSNRVSCDVCVRSLLVVCHSHTLTGRARNLGIESAGSVSGKERNLAKGSTFASLGHTKGECGESTDVSRVAHLGSTLQFVLRTETLWPSLGWATSTAPEGRSTANIRREYSVTSGSTLNQRRLDTRVDQSLSGVGVWPSTVEAGRNVGFLGGSVFLDFVTTKVSLERTSEWFSRCSSRSDSG